MKATPALVPEDVPCSVGDDLAASSRRDGSGRSWSPLEKVADDGENTLGNPCALVDSSTKTVWLAFTRSLGSDTEKTIVMATSQERTRVLATKTLNDGTNWSKAVDITAAVKRPDWTSYGTGTGTGIQVTTGRLLIPASHADEETGVYRSHMVFSDDHGRTWMHRSAVGEHCASVTWSSEAMAIWS